MRLRNPVRLLVRWLTRWAWEPEYSQGQEAIELFQQKRNVATLKTLQLSLLEELFREKQAKITRLQFCYNEKRRPLYEDLRKENPIKDTESLAQSISVMASRAEAARARGLAPRPYSDGTVLGVPGDSPNVEVGDGW